MRACCFGDIQRCDLASGFVRRRARALRPVEAQIALQADEVLGSDLLNPLLLCVRPDPFELCFRSALCTSAHGPPLTLSVDSGTNADERRVPARTPSIRFTHELRDAEPCPPEESPPHRKREEA